MEDLVAIAKIAKPRGLKGEVAADLLTDFPDRFEGLENVVVLLADGERTPQRIEDAWFQNGRVVLKFAGIDSIDAAETLRGAEICVPENEAVDLEEGEYFDWQLQGCTVETIEGLRIGAVSEVMRTGGTEILVVASDEKEYLIPFAGSICTEVDTAKKVIRIDPPEGLLEF